MKKLAQGADTSVYLASSPEAKELTGQYFANRLPKESHKASYDRSTTARLWRVSADLVGLSVAAPSVHGA
jgi:hypothetical protein